jgi:hypothetical protein
MIVNRGPCGTDLTRIFLSHFSFSGENGLSLVMSALL